jgi:hypothetical protein
MLIGLLVLAVAAGCSSANLGQLDETPSERDDMPGPGIFADQNGESVLTWSPAQKQAKSTPAEPGSPTPDERTEFEQFKKWERLRAEGEASAEYREFLQWLKYQQFKAAQ